ncbi:MAG: hypothetical protein R3C19_13585 [Planctomycetaceae bacterium]
MVSGSDTNATMRTFASLQPALLLNFAVTGTIAFAGHPVEAAFWGAIVYLGSAAAVRLWLERDLLQIEAAVDRKRPHTWRLPIGRKAMLMAFALFGTIHFSLSTGFWTVIFLHCYLWDPSSWYWMNSELVVTFCLCVTALWAFSLSVDLAFRESKAAEGVLFLSSVYCAAVFVAGTGFGSAQIYSLGPPGTTNFWATWWWYGKISGSWSLAERSTAATIFVALVGAVLWWCHRRRLQFLPHMSLARVVKSPLPNQGTQSDAR